MTSHAGLKLQGLEPAKPITHSVMLLTGGEEKRIAGDGSIAGEDWNKLV
jgi:hypothetical protein